MRLFRDMRNGALGTSSSGYGRMNTPGAILGVDFGAPRRARDQRRKIVAIAAFDFPFCIPDALLRDAQFAADAGHDAGAFIAGGRSTGTWRNGSRSAIRSTSARSMRGARAPIALGSGPSAAVPTIQTFAIDRAGNQAS
jgi:hypothetical protein